MRPLIKKIEGKNNFGKKILIIAGVHGNELTPVFAVGEMIRTSTFEELSDKFSKITFINGLNISGLRNNTREIFSDSSQDINRMLSNETSIEYIEILKEHIEDSDVVIDIHSSPTCANFALIDIDEYAESIMDWCVESDIKCAFRYSGASTIKRYCLEKNKLSVTLELNRMNTIDKNSANDCIKMVRRLIEKSNNFNLKKCEPKISEPMRELKTYQEGIINNYRKNGDYISEGSVVAEVFDFSMDKIGEIKAETSGWVVCQPSNDYVKRGDVIMLIQPE
jgi:predicted deacylase